MAVQLDREGTYRAIAPKALETLEGSEAPTTPRWNDWVCAFTTVILLSLSFWTNCPQREQASQNFQPTVSSHSLSLINR